MKAVLCTQFGLPDTLQVQEVSTPIAGPNQVVITVAACGVNFPDVLIIQNKYQFKPELPFHLEERWRGSCPNWGTRFKA